MERGRSAEQQSHVAKLNREFSRFCHFVGRSDCLREWPRDRSRYLQFTVYTELWQRNSIRTKRIGYGKTSANVNVHWRKKRINICIFVMLVRKRQKCDTKYIRNIEQTQECIFMLPVSIIVTIPFFFFFFVSYHFYVTSVQIISQISQSCSYRYLERRRKIILSHNLE